MVRVIRRREDDESLKEAQEKAKMPAMGTVVYIGERFVVAAMYSDSGEYLYCESFWPKEVRAWEESNTSGRN